MQVAIKMNWNDTLKKKQLYITKNNENENKKRINYAFRVGDYAKIIHKNTYFRPNKLSTPNEGLYHVVEVLHN